MSSRHSDIYNWRLSGSNQLHQPLSSSTSETTDWSRLFHNTLSLINQFAERTKLSNQYWGQSASDQSDWRISALFIIYSFVLNLPQESKPTLAVACCWVDHLSKQTRLLADPFLLNNSPTYFGSMSNVHWPFINTKKLAWGHIGVTVKGDLSHENQC